MRSVDGLSREMFPLWSKCLDDLEYHARYLVTGNLPVAEDECLELIGVHSACLQDIWHLFFNMKSGDSLTDDLNHMWSKVLPVSSASQIENHLSSRWMLDVKCECRKIEPIWRVSLVRCQSDILNTHRDL